MCSKLPAAHKLIIKGEFMLFTWWFRRKFLYLTWREKPRSAANPSSCRHGADDFASLLVTFASNIKNTFLWNWLSLLPSHSLACHASCISDTLSFDFSVAFSLSLSSVSQRVHSFHFFPSFYFSLSFYVSFLFVFRLSPETNATKATNEDHRVGRFNFLHLHGKWLFVINIISFFLCSLLFHGSTIDACHVYK